MRHPDTCEMLPAEASGRIRPGDQLVDINGTNVEGIGGDEATALIRKVNTVVANFNVGEARANER